MALDHPISPASEEAAAKLKLAISTISQLNNFTLIIPPKIVQQKENIYCGTYTGVNCIGIVLYKLRHNIRFPFNFPTNLLIPVDVKNGTGLLTRPQQALELITGVLKIAALANWEKKPDTKPVKLDNNK